MVDLVPEPIWNWVSKAWRIMDDLAEKIDDLICTFEGGGDNTMDTLAMYMFGWMFFGLFVLGVGKFVYSKYFKLKGQKDKSDVVEPLISNKTENNVADSNKVNVLKDTPVRAITTGGKYVPPTPPMRKRLGSRSGRSPGPVRLKSTTSHPPPTATGAESESVKWVNELFSWLYSDFGTVSELLNVWIQSLNEFTKQSVTEHGVGVEFVRVLNESPPPSISNVFCECAPNDDITITCDCEAMPSLQLKVFRQKGEKVEVSHYRLNVNKFRARLHIFAITEKLTTDVSCDGWPEIKVALAPVGAIKSNLDESQLQEVICDIVTGALRHSNVQFNLSPFPSCPRLIRNQHIGHLLPLHYDAIAGNQRGHIQSSRRILVKVIKAVSLGLSQGCSEPYCIVEVDEPPQKNQTSIKKDTDCPVWDEHFLFDVNSRTSEILLEVYDRCHGDTKFLGLGIVSMEELLMSPSQRQVISLQATPEHENNPVSGTLTVEFLLIEGADLPVSSDKPFKLKESLKSVPMIQSSTVLSQPQIERLTNGNLGETAVRQLNRTGGTQPSKSTLIIHSVQRAPQQEILKTSPNQQQQSGPLATDTTEINDRSRSRRRKRDFFGSLRQRLSRSKGRSKSAGPPLDDEAAAALQRSISADRNRDPSAHSVQSTVPGLREDSARSSISEASGISGASNRTYVHEASTLVLETLENGIKKYYLVPLSMAQRTKWKKKGTKLHIFNDHTFIAKHLSSGTVCQVCKKMLARRLGKQGYECRDCLYKCHKHCHVKVETTCPTSNILNIELCSETESPFSLRKFKSSPKVSPR